MRAGIGACARRSPRRHRGTGAADPGIVAPGLLFVSDPRAKSTLTSIGVAEPPSPGVDPVSARPFSGERTLFGGRYEILGLIGSGGMGNVYRARDLELDELVALKLLRADIADGPGVIERFRREAKLARRVTHVNVARVFDIGEDAGERFLTMELVDGESLAAQLAREGPLGHERALAVAAAVAAGLAGAHAAGVVHLDLKPENVLLARDGRVVVTDFGIARAAQDVGGDGDEIFGTPAYMAPEQVTGRRDVGARADIYAFGALLYEIFTGRAAWSGPSAHSVASARLLGRPPDPRAVAPHLPAALGALVVHCLARAPEDRPASIEQVAAALAGVAFPAASAGDTARMAPLPEDRLPTKTVAVLPFRNAGPLEDGYLAEELTDDLIDALSMTGHVKVRARGAVARLRGGEHDPRELGRQLGVQVVVEGSVRRSPGRVRVSARILSVSDGFQLWAKRIERPDHEVLSISDDVAEAVAAALTLDGKGAAREAPEDARALDLYLRGRHEYRKFWPEHQRRAVALFNEALAIAPDDPIFLSATAMAHARLAFFAGDAGLAEARAAAERATRVGPGMGEAHLALGSVLLQIGEGQGAVRALRQAIARGPGLAEAHAALGRVLVETGAVADGLRRLDAALDLDPHVPLAVSALARTHGLLGQWDRSDQLVEGLREAEGGYSYWIVRVRFALWRRQGAPAGVDLGGAPASAVLDLPRAMLETLVTGARPATIPTVEAVSRMPDIGARRRLMYYQMYAEMAGYLRDAELVHEVLRHAAAGGLIDLLWLTRCPLFDDLRGDARYVAVETEVRRRAEEILASLPA
jgi:serine/threonine-protein kinase